MKHVFIAYSTDAFKSSHYKPKYMYIIEDGYYTLTVCNNDIITYLGTFFACSWVEKMQPFNRNLQNSIG